MNSSSTLATGLRQNTSVKFAPQRSGAQTQAGSSSQECARSTRGEFVGDNFQPWLSGSDRGGAWRMVMEGRVVVEVRVSRMFWYPCTGTRARELEDRTSG